MRNDIYRAVSIVHAGPVTWSAPKIFYIVKQFWALPRQAPPAMTSISRAEGSLRHRRAVSLIFQEVTKSEVQPSIFSANWENTWRETVTLRKRKRYCERNEASFTLCKTRGQHVQTTWQKYVGTFPQKLWKAVGKVISPTQPVDNHTSFPTYTPRLSTYLSTQLLHLSHLFRPDLSALSTHTTITTTT